MEINQGLYPAYLIASAVLGVLLGAVYDIFRILRLWRHRGGWVECILIFGEDILFALIAAVTFSVQSYAMNRGRIRWFALLFAGVGFWLYRVTLSRAVMAGANQLRRLLQSLWRATGGRLIGLLSARIQRKRAQNRTKKTLSRLIRETEQGKWTENAMRRDKE